MPTYDASNARCRVFTFKEGLLSAIAHDLEIDVTRFTIEVAEDGSSVVGRFDPRSLRVLHAMSDGRPSPGTLSDKDKRKIESNIAADVLEVKRHGEEIELRSTAVELGDDGGTITGRLSLHGRERDLTLRVERDGEARVTRARLHQPDFGIKPYSAMMGTLRIKPDIEVEVRLER